MVDRVVLGGQREGKPVRVAEAAARHEGRFGCPVDFDHERFLKAARALDGALLQARKSGANAHQALVHVRVQAVCVSAYVVDVLEVLVVGCERVWKTAIHPGSG